MTLKLLEPVINDKEEPCWLVINGYEKVANGKTKIIKDKKGKNPKIVNDTPLKEKPKFELQPMGLWQCQPCGCIIRTDGKEPMECYENQGGCARKTNFEVLTKRINPNLWKIPKWKDIPTDDIDMQGLYNDLLKLTKRCIIFVKYTFPELILLAPRKKRKNIYRSIITIWFLRI